MLMHPLLADASAGHDLVPLWTHMSSGGRPLAANPGYALLHPLSLLLRPFPFDVAFNLFLIVHVGIAGLTMIGLARRLGASRPAAFAAGAAYGLGGGVLSAASLYWAVVPVAWAPLMIHAGIAATRSPRPRSLAALAVVLMLQANGGQPEPLAAALLVGLVLTLSVSVLPFPRRLWRAGWVWGAAGAWGLALSAAQLLPAALHARTTVRSLGFTAAGVLYNSLHPMRLPAFFWPGYGGSPLERLPAKAGSRRRLARRVARLPGRLGRIEGDQVQLGEPRLLGRRRSVDV